MNKRGTIAEIAAHLVTALRPFVTIVASPDNFKQFMFRMGWNADNMPAEFPNIGLKINASLEKLSLLGDDPPMTQSFDLLQSVKGVFDHIQGLGPSAVPIGVDPGQFLPEIKERLFE